MFSATLGCTNEEAQTRAVYACVSVQISMKVAPTKDGRTWFQKSETSSKTAVDVTTRQKTKGPLHNNMQHHHPKKKKKKKKKKTKKKKNQGNQTADHSYNGTHHIIQEV